MRSEVRSLENEAYDEGTEDFEALLNASFKDNGDEESVGKVVEGVIVEINDEFALVDVGMKIEGRLYLSELQDEEGNLVFKKDERLPVLMMGIRNERPTISYKRALKQRKRNEFIEQHKDSDEIITVHGKVTRSNKGGYVVEADDIEFFMPRSLAAFRDGENPVNREVEARLVKVDEKTGSVIISRQAIMNERRKARKDLLKKLVDDKEIVQGTVKKIKSYGMFVDVGGIDGLVHYSEISYKGPVNPSSLYKEGDIVEVIATDYDKQTKKLSLSIKQTQADPWGDIAEQLEAGDTIKVMVSNIEPYGAFVDLGNEIEGFLHISEMSWEKNLKHPTDVVEVNQEIDVEVIEINPDERRLRVSLKRLQPKPYELFKKSRKEGDVVEGEITTLTDFGAFVKIDQVEGLLHNEDASWGDAKCKSIYKVGDKVEVKIIKIDAENERISLSRRVLEDSPVEKYANEHKIGDIVKGPIRGVKDFGAFVQLAENVDGLIRKEDMYPLKPEELEAGQEVEAVISALDVAKNRIRLSVRRLEKQREKEQLEAFNNDESVSQFGDALKEALK